VQFVIESQHEYLIAGLARLNESECGSLDVRLFRIHARAGIQHKPNRCRTVFSDEQIDALPLAVFFDIEVFFCETVHGLSALIQNTHVENDEIDINSQSVGLPLAM
jgi:hypothetical protein